MELFSVNRYSGNTKNDTVQNKEDEILKNLLKKVEKRKRKSKKSSTEIIATNNDELPIENEHDETEYSIKKKQKLDLLVELENNNNEETSTQVELEKQSQNDILDENFQVLGNDVFEKRRKIEMVLPPWLSHPTIISSNISTNNQLIEMDNDDWFHISAQIKTNLKSMGFTQFFPVQKEVIPWILNNHTKPVPFRPRDICVSAPTGSGKTLAFAIPIIQLLSEHVERKIRALIILPVNELAVQVYTVCKQIAKNTNISICLLSKSISFVTEQQQLVKYFNGKYYSKVDIVVTTPGRLVDHLHETKGLDLKNLQFLVMDEADTIMTQIHHNWLYHLDEHVRLNTDLLLSNRSIPLCLYELENNLYKLPHKMLFSATLSQDPEKLQNLRLFHPKLFTSVATAVSSTVTNNYQNKLIESNLNDPKKQFDLPLLRGEFIGKYTTPVELTEKYCLTENRLKPLTLYAMIQANKWNKFLCFTNSADSAHRLAWVLKEMFKSKKKLIIEELSAMLPQTKRSIYLDLFSRGKINGLICSDALARGIDIPEIDIVISYDCARHIKTYIHRVGRTARAGRHGTAITLLDNNELQKFKKIVMEGGKEVTEEIKTDSLIEEQNAKNYSRALEKLQNHLETLKKKNTVRKNIVKEVTKQTDAIYPDNSIEFNNHLDQLQAQAEKQLLNNLQNLEDPNADELSTKISRKLQRRNIRKKNKKKLI